MLKQCFNWIKKNSKTLEEKEKLVVEDSNFFKIYLQIFRYPENFITNFSMPGQI
jgi:hypothetical protein